MVCQKISTISEVKPDISIIYRFSIFKSYCGKHYNSKKNKK